MPLYNTPPEQEQAAPDDLDIQIATGLLSVALMEKGLDAVSSAASQPNPITPLSSILTIMLKELLPSLEQSGMGVDPNVWLSDGGAVDRAIDLMGQMTGGLPDEVKNGVFMEVVDQMKLLSNQSKNQGIQQPQGGEGMGPSGNSGAPPQPMQPPMGGV